MLIGSFDDRARVMASADLALARETVLATLRATAQNPRVRTEVGTRSALAWYGIALCREWIRRGHRDDLLPKIARFVGWPAWRVAKIVSIRPNRRRRSVEVRWRTESGEIACERWDRSL
jgi:hypothetical protein